MATPRMAKRRIQRLALPCTRLLIVGTMTLVGAGCSDNDDPAPSVGEACLRAQQRAVRTADMTNAFDLVTTTVAGPSPQAARWVRAEARSLARRVAGRCGDAVPPQLATFLDQTNAATRSPGLDHHQVAAIRAAWRTWANAVDVAPADIEQFKAEARCRSIVRHIDISYRLDSRAGGALRTWTMWLIWDNRLDHRMWLQFGGRARARGLVDPDDGNPKVPGGGTLVTWGGGSGEIGYRPAGPFRQQISISPPLRTAPDGKIVVLDFYADVSRHGGRSCAVPVSAR